MNSKPKILLVNDDGADAPGLWALFKEIEWLGQPVVIAPLREQSARGHAITVRQPMPLSEVKLEGRQVGYQLGGTPADCVKLALAEIYRDQIAMVISGINWGANVGHNILYSGTVGAALEAAMYGLPALAVSLRDESGPPAHYGTAACVARRLAANVLARGLPPGVILNVNVPNLPLSEVAGIALTRQGQETYVDLFEISRRSDGTTVCTNLGGERLSSRASEHPLDDLTLNSRIISITPLDFDLTSSTALNLLNDWITGLSLQDDEQKEGR